MLRKLIRTYFAELFSTWASGITGAASIPFTILCLFADGPKQRVTFGVTAATLFLVASFQTWRKEYLRAEAEHARAEAALAAPPVPPVTSNDWERLANEFKQFQFQTRADYQRTDGVTTWRVVADPQCGALCLKAGAMLLKTPAILSQLSSEAKTAEDHVTRWLEFLKQRFGLENMNYGSNEEGKIVIWIGSVGSLQARSVILCTECSAAVL